MDGFLQSFGSFESSSTATDAEPAGLGLMTTFPAGPYSPTTATVMDKCPSFGMFRCFSDGGFSLAPQQQQQQQQPGFPVIHLDGTPVCLLSVNSPSVVSEVHTSANIREDGWGGDQRSQAITLEDHSSASVIAEIFKSKSKKSCSDNGKGGRCLRNNKEEHGVVHVRAKRGQATDRHSVAERVRREKINEKMRFLRGLVPGCYKAMGMALMLDEIIKYVQSLQNQVEFLSTKLTAASAVYDFNLDQLDDALAMMPRLLPSHIMAHGGDGGGGREVEGDGWEADSAMGERCEGVTLASSELQPTMPF